MKYTIDYSSLEGQAKVDKAVADCRFWLGDKFDYVVDAIEPYSVDMRVSMLSFAGIEGYPAHALAVWVDERGHADGAMPRSREEELMDDDLHADDAWHERRDYYDPDKPDVG